MGKISEGLQAIGTAAAISGRGKLSREKKAATNRAVKAETKVKKLEKKYESKELKGISPDRKKDIEKVKKYHAQHVSKFSTKTAKDYRAAAKKKGGKK